jgi:hypothetical protein
LKQTGMIIEMWDVSCKVFFLCLFEERTASSQNSATGPALTTALGQHCWWTWIIGLWCRKGIGTQLGITITWSGTACLQLGTA